jgi:hypothetical protein
VKREQKKQCTKIAKILFLLLKLIPGCENENDDIQKWINQDEEQQLTDNNIVDLANHAGDDDSEDDNKGPEKADRMNHSEGLNSIETTLAYVEQQREATAEDILLFRHWRDLAAKKRKEAQKQTPITNFLKNKLFHLQIYIMLNIIFVCEIFSFDSVLYFLPNLITSQIEL